MKLPLGEAMLFSYAGIVSATVAVGIKIEFSGEARYTYKNTTVTTYTYFDGECSSSSYEKGPVHDFNAKCEFKAGAYIELNVCFLCVSLLHAKAFIGLEAKAEFKIELGETKPVNMLDCVEIAIDLIVEVKLTVGIGKLEIETADFKLIDLELARLHYHFLDEFYTFNPETNELIWAGKKDRFHSESDCPYDVMTVKLMFPWLSNQLHASYDVGLPGTPFNKPEDPDLSMYDRRFLAWHTRADLGENSRVDEWPYMVNESVSLYADSAILYDLNFVYTNGKPVCKAYKAIEGEEVALPTSDRRHTITGWIVIDDDENMTQLDRLDEGATEFSMPDDDVWLCAICPDDIVINFYTGIGTDARSVYCSRNEPVQAPEFVLSRPRHKFIGWTDADGNEVVFPFTPDRNSPAVVSFHALWEYTGEMTASDLDGNDFGYVPSTSDFGEKQSGTEYFYYEVSEGEVTITGFRYDSKESPKNLYIPSTINGDKVTRIKADAFKGLSTLKAVTLSEYIEEIGAGAFSGCTDLRLIDMSYVINLSHIPNSFARECYNLVCVMMPSGVRSYGASSFFDCSSLAKVNIEGQVGDYAFANCKSLSEVNFGKAKYGNTSDYAIGSYAFYQCLALKEIVIPDCVNDIGSNFISGNKNIESVVFDGKPETITSGMMQIGEGSKLSSLTLGDGVRALGNKALANGDKGFPLLKTLAIPASVTSIGESALMGSGIEKLELYSPELVIGKSILNNCADIKEVIVHAGTIGSYAFSDNQSIEKVVIGQAVKAVEPYVFKNCSAFKRWRYAAVTLNITRWPNAPV